LQPTCATSDAERRFRSLVVANRAKCFAPEHGDGGEGQHEQGERSRKADLVGQDADHGRTDDEPRVAERERCGERGSRRVDAPGGAEEQGRCVGDPEAAEDEADDGRTGLADQQHAAECDSDERGSGAQEPAGAEPGVDEVAPEPTRGHAERKAGECKCGGGGVRAGVVLEVDAAPVADRALGEHHQEAEAADQEHGLRRKREPVPFGVVRGRGAQPSGDPEAEQPQGDADDQALEARVEPGRRCESDDSGGGESSHAPAAVERRHDRSVELLLDRDAVSVHRDVHRTRARSEDEEDRCEHGRAGGK
jgi:hypothetical protein